MSAETGALLAKTLSAGIRYIEFSGSDTIYRYFFSCSRVVKPDWDLLSDLDILK